MAEGADWSLCPRCGGADQRRHTPRPVYGDSCLVRQPVSCENCGRNYEVEFAPSRFIKDKEGD
jgi:hypothetical protein